MPRNMACQVVSLQWHEVCQDSKATHSLRHVVLSVTHKLRTVHDTHCHACALYNVVVISRDTFEKLFEHFRIFITTWHALLQWPASPRLPTHAVTSSCLVGTPNCVPWRKPFVVPLSSLLKPLWPHQNRSATDHYTAVQLSRPRLPRADLVWWGVCVTTECILCKMFYYK